MTTTTFEAVKKCPRCGKYGKERSRHPGEKGSRVHVFMCVNEQCKWFETGWLVQVMRDGSIAERKPGEKDFEPLEEYQKQRARDSIRAHKENEQRGEITRP